MLVFFRAATGSGVSFREDMGPAPQHTDAGHGGAPIEMRISAALRLTTGGIEVITRGDVAFGRAVRSAVTVRLSGWRRPSIVLSFGTMGQREQFLRALDYQCALGNRLAA